MEKTIKQLLHEAYLAGVNEGMKSVETAYASVFNHTNDIPAAMEAYAKWKQKGLLVSFAGYMPDENGK